MQETYETQVQSIGWEDPQEEGMATHSSILAWRIPMNRGAWWAADHSITKSQTGLKWLSTHTCTGRLIRGLFMRCGEAVVSHTSSDEPKAETARLFPRPLPSPPPKSAGEKGSTCSGEEMCGWEPAWEELFVYPWPAGRWPSGNTRLHSFPSLWPPQTEGF